MTNEMFVIEKSNPLKGRVKIDGAKNSVLPILAATILTKDVCVIRDVPNLSDVDIMEKILNSYNVLTKRDVSGGIFKTDAKKIVNIDGKYDLISKMRASFLIMGPLLARFGFAKMPLPGGCAIGSRPVELHLKGLSMLGAKIYSEHGYIIAEARKLKGAKIYLDFPSVGATENIMMAAAVANGTTIIENCAVEPEIVDLSNFLTLMGANIKGAGTDTIKIVGVKKLKGAEHTIIPDRIEAGTFMIAAVMTKGDVILENVVWDHLKPIIAKLEETNAHIESVENGIRVRVYQKQKARGVDVKTLPYPGFPTDLQAQFMSLLTLVEGTSVITETVFENRFMHVGELKRLGADIKIEGRSAIVEGTEKCFGTQVKATDLRAGAALILSGLVAEGETEISDIYHVDRGYCGFELKLQKLGAKIKRVETVL